MLTRDDYRQKVHLRADPAKRCTRCALLPADRSTWPPRNCPLHDCIADLCPFHVEPESPTTKDKP